MKVEFYNNQDDPNIINKTPQKISELDITFRQAIDEKQPILIMHNTNLQNVNYVYIPLFKRYYFINNISNYNNVLSQVTLSTDYLMTYQDTILNTEMKITATNKPSYLSSSLPTTEQITTRKKLSDVTLDNKNSIVLTTIGGLNTGEW